MEYHDNKLYDLDLDLDINNYTLKDLFNLFHIDNYRINIEDLKHAKKMVLKMHPDKSKLDAKFFLFFSTAYKKLYSIYEFQNKNTNKKIVINEYETNEYYKDENKNILNVLFDKNKELEDPKQFNKWFNQQFEKHKLNIEEENKGYGEWLKGDEGIYNTNPVSMGTMHEEFEKQKRNIQAISVYNGINDPYASTLGGTLLGNSNDNFSSGLFDNSLQFQDLRQAHIETIIPICKEDYDNMPKYKSEQEYKSCRDRQDIKPIKEEEALKKLRYNENKIEEESAHLAFYYAKQAEEAEKKKNDFWSSLKQLK
jgi:hypothetical protein